jgi:dTDP-4-dehydrorhamnose reductase
MRPRILITGGAGLLALNWAAAVRERFDVTLVFHNRQVSLSGVNRVRVDLDSRDALEKSLEELAPDVVIHTAGLTSVEACEADPVLAKHVNVDLSKTLAIACAKLNIPMVHISTDHLFQGKEAFADESFSVDPMNMYGKTKAEAEVKVLEANPNALVVRTNFYGWGTSYRHSFSDMVMNALRLGKTVSLFNDVFYSPILAESLVNTVHQLVEKRANGIFNVVGDDRVSKYDFGLKLAADFNLDSNLIVLGKLADRASLVQRPYDMSLSNRKVSKFLGGVIGGLDQHISILKHQEENGLAQELLKL